MPHLFTVKWPHFALVEASLMLPVAVVAAGTITAPQLPQDDGMMMAVGGAGVSPAVAKFVLLFAVPAIMTALPFLGLLMVVDRLLIVRRGFAILACVATVLWIGLAAALADPVAARLPGDLASGAGFLSFQSVAALAVGTLALLVHLRVLWIGLHDNGYAAMRRGVERRVPAGSPMSRVRQWDAATVKDASRRRAATDEQRQRFMEAPDRLWYQAPLGIIVVFIVIGGWIYASYRWVYSGERHDHAAPAAEQSEAARDPADLLMHAREPRSPDVSDFDNPASDGTATTPRDRAGRYVFEATVNGVPMAMVYDDDVPLVTLRAEDAVRIGISFNRLDFSTKIKTDKGSAEAAGITISAMTVGSITYKLVPGLVVRAGVLETSLLGHSFVGRLTNYRIESDRLTFSGSK